MMVCVWTVILKMNQEILVLNVPLVAKLALLPVSKVVKCVGIHLPLHLLIVLVPKIGNIIPKLIYVFKYQTHLQHLQLLLMTTVVIPLPDLLLNSPLWSLFYAYLT